MSDRLTIIILENEDTIETYGSLKKACRLHKEFSYHYIKSKKFPFCYKGWNFYRVRFNERQFCAKK